jgi:hypothetical protein
LGIGIDICTYRGIGKESFPRSLVQRFCKIQQGFL